MIDLLLKGHMSNLHLRSLLLWFAHDLNKEALLGDFFKYLKILITVSKWVVLGADKNWLITLAASLVTDR